EIVTEAAKRINMPFVTERWLGGMLTNFNTVRKSVKKMQSIEKMLNDGTLDSITKKERLTLTRDRDKMEKVLGGIAQISRVPAALFLVDIGHEHIALSEAKRLNITTFGMVDTNCDPNKVEFSIPANDDATKSIAIVTNYIVAAIAEGLAERQAEKAEETDDTDDGSSDAIKFDMGTEEDKERRRGGSGGPAGGKGRGPAGPQKRRVAGPGTGGNRPGGPGGRR
ncbi:MAG: 30S ribosomal protein S2, partial [Ginsengibacter sp.]